MASNYRPNWFKREVNRDTIDDKHFEQSNNNIRGQLAIVTRVTALKAKKKKFEFNLPTPSLTPSLTPSPPLPHMRITSRPPLTKSPVNLFKKMKNEADMFHKQLTNECGLNHGEKIGEQLNKLFSVYAINNNHGTKTGIRKIGSLIDPLRIITPEVSRTYYNNTIKEQNMYDILLQFETPEKSHLLPIRRPASGWCRGEDYTTIDFDFLPGEDLYTFLQKDAISEEDKYTVLLHATKNLLWLASNKFIHGDIGATNMFVHNVHDVRIFDFSHLAPTKNNLEQFMSEIFGSSVGFVNSINSVKLSNTPDINSFFLMLKTCKCNTTLYNNLFHLALTHLKDTNYNINEYYLNAIHIIQNFIHTNFRTSETAGFASSSSFLGGNRTRKHCVSSYRTRKHRVSSYRRRQRIR